MPSSSLTLFVAESFCPGAVGVAEHLAPGRDGWAWQQCVSHPSHSLRDEGPVPRRATWGAFGNRVNHQGLWTAKFVVSRGWGDLYLVPAGGCVGWLNNFMGWERTETCCSGKSRSCARSPGQEGWFGRGAYPPQKRNREGNLQLGGMKPDWWSPPASPQMSK